MIRKLFITFFVLFMAISPTLVLPVVAATNPGIMSFSVKAVLPENQINKDNTYFDLKMNPGQSQTLTVIVYNNSNEELQTKIAVKAAATSNSGLIDYNGSVTPDETLKMPFSTIAKVENETIKIPATKSKEAKIHIEMPNDPYDGVILGGIVITEIPKDSSQGSSSGLNIKNEYSYVIGVKLSETDRQVAPDLKLKSVEPNLANYRTAMVARIQNIEPAIIKGMSVTASVYKAGEAVAFRQSKQNVVDMAPNSTYAFPIDWENQRIEKGKYRLHLVAVGDKKWEWDEEFTIEDTAANNVNQNSLYMEKQPIWMYILGGIGLLVIVLLLALLLKSRGKEKRQA